MSYEEGQQRNLCCVCKEDLGAQNPRQLCRKTYCPEQSLLELDVDNDSLTNQSNQSLEQPQQPEQYGLEQPQPMEEELMCESCSLKSSQSSNSTNINLNSVPTQDQPTQIVNLVSPPFQNLKTEESTTKKYPANDIRSFLAITKK